MADRPGTNSYRRASRATVVIRKAKEADAERVAARPDRDEESGRKKILSGRYEAPVPAAPADAQAGSNSARASSGRSHRVSGRTVVIRKDEAGRVVSSRLSGRHAESVLVAGGDTITRYSSGEVVIRRAGRGVSLRRQALLLYAAGYFLLFGLYGYFMLTGTYSLDPEEYLSRAFARRHSSSVADLELAALTAMRGNRTPGEMRLAEKISFYDEARNAVTIEAGERLTLADSVQLAPAISNDQALPEERRAFRSPLTLYRDTYLGSVDWPHLLSVYNSLGFFLLLGLFLWRPLAGYLATQGKKTAVALRIARAAVAEAEGYDAKFRQLERDTAERSGALRTNAEGEAEAALATARAAAEREAAALAGASAAAIAGEERARAARLAAAASEEACAAARELLAGRLGEAEHNAAIEDLIAALAGARAVPAGNAPAGRA